MKDREFLKIVDDSGQEKQYEILMSFKWSKTDKNYVIYTDSSSLLDEEINVYASIYYPNDSSRLDDIETEEEWELIESKMEELACGE